jgi:hypothetical protein
MVVEPTSKATPKSRSWNPGHTAIKGEAGEAPFGLEGVGQPLQIRAGVGHAGFFDFDIVQSNDGVDGEVRHLRALTHHLAVDVAVGRNVDHDVSADRDGATEAAAGGQRTPAPIIGLGRSRR